MMRRKVKVKTTFNLPEDIVFAEILPRISSINSLLRFKSVSKPWCSLISSEKFAKNQLEKSPAKSTSLAVMIALNDEYFAVNHCHVDDLFSQQIIDVDQFETDYPESDYVTGVAGCCNGLYCILIAQKHFILVNPYTRKYHKLPPLDNEEPSILGYGYGESNNDYRVFAHDGQVSKLYSFKTNSWKTVKGPRVDDFRKGVFLNGKLHWAKRTGSKSHEFDVKIVTFDLGSEKRKFLSTPSFAHSCLDPKLMSVIQGCICLPHCSSSHSTDIWVMKEYGVKESWCKVLTFPTFGRSFDRAYRVPIPIWISQEGEVLVQHNYSFLIYNPKTNTHRCLEVNTSSAVLDIDIGTRSLVSPFPNEMSEKDMAIG